MYQKGERRNKNNIFVRECITEALFSLLKQKEFDEFTITDVINKSGVSRMGFYRNFKSKESIIEDFIRERFVETVEDIESKRTLNFAIDNIVITTLENFKRYSSYIKLFIDRNMDDLLYHCYCRAFYSLYNVQKEGKKHSVIREYSIQTFIGELFNLEMCWLRNGMKETPEELTKIYYRILKLRCQGGVKI